MLRSLAGFVFPFTAAVFLGAGIASANVVINLPRLAFPPDDTVQTTRDSGSLAHPILRPR